MKAFIIEAAIFSAFWICVGCLVGKWDRRQVSAIMMFVAAVFGTFLLAHKDDILGVAVAPPVAAFFGCKPEQVR